MSEREQYPAGVPCWVEVLVPEPRKALEFYGSLFDWTFDGAGPMPDDPAAEYFVASVRGREVAGVGSLPTRDDPVPPAWTTYVRVASADEAARSVVPAGGVVIADAFDVPPVGRMAVVADPGGAVFCLWEAGSREGAQIVNEPRAWAMSALQCAGSERDVFIDFYREMFGWEPEPFGPATLYRLPGYVGGEVRQPVPRDVVAVMTPSAGDGNGPSAPAYWGVDFWVDDADAVAENATSMGGEVLVAPMDTPGFRNAVLTDPQGASFSVSQLLGPH